MKRLIRNMFPWLAALTLVIALGSGCTDKPTGNDLTSGGNIDLRARVTSSAGVEQVNLFVLTVSARDMDTVIDTLLFEDGEIVGEIEVPVGTQRKFVLEAWDQPAVGGPPVLIYRGVTITDVLPGQIVHLVINMEPVVPMVRLSPRFVEMESGSVFTVDIEADNIPGLAGAIVFLDFAGFEGDIQLVSVDRHASQRSTVFATTLESDNPSVYVIDTLYRSMVNSEGDGAIATMTFMTRAFIDDITVMGNISIIQVDMIDENQDEIPTNDVLTDFCEVVLTSQTDRVITFPDSTLEDAVMRYAKLTEPPIYFSDVQYFTTFDAVELGVEDWTGLGEITNLQNLYLDWNDAPDLTPLAPLVGLTYLSIQGNEVTGIAPLAHLIGLRTLDLYWNQITNITPLSGLSQLRSLNLSSNMVVNLAPLSGLIFLSDLQLQNNNISDISPLLENPGLGGGDTIDLSGNPLDDNTQQQLMDALRERGATVYYGT